MSTPPKSGFFKKIGEDWKPHAYQKKAVKFLLNHSCAGLFLDPGLGKTSCTLAAYKLLKQQGLVHSMLVVAPLRVCYSVWPAEGKRWLDFKDVTIALLHGDKKDEVPAGSDIYVINPEGLGWFFHNKKRLKNLNIDMLVIDESTKFKSPSSGRFKLLKQYLEKFKRRVILTGSPAPNGLEDLWSQMYILDLGRALSPYITQYRKMYFSPPGMGQFGWTIRPGSDELINTRIKSSILRLDAKDYLDLPEIIINDVKVMLPPKAYKVYKEMEKIMISIVEDREVVAINAAAAMMKCKQIANGGLYYSDELAHTSGLDRDRFSHIHDAKTEALQEILESVSGSPVLIAYEFKHDLDRLQKALGKDVPYIGGGMSAKRSKELQDLWNNDKLPILIGQPASMAHGLNLQGGSCRTIVWYSLTWNYEYYDQFIRRIVRQGSKHKSVVVHRIIADKTVDIAQVMALSDKRIEQNGLLDALRIYIKG